MPYYYKRPGDWLWHPHDTSSLAEDVRCGRLSADWKYRVEGDPNEHSLAELLEAERARRNRPLTPTEKQMLAPDGTWGLIVVVACLLLLLFVIVVPVREGASGSGKFYLAGFALVWMSWGIRLIHVSRAWKARHRPRPNHAMERTSQTRDRSSFSR